MTWYSDNNNIASVNSSGQVTGKNVGTTYINAKTANGKEAYCKVTVESKTVEPTSISVSPSTKTIKVGDTFTATYSLTPSNATTTVTWYSDNNNIASVNSSGQVTGKNVGTTYINAKTANGKEAYCKVTVDPGDSYPNVTFISVTTSNTNLERLTRNDFLKFRATFKNIGLTANVRTTLAILNKSTRRILYKSNIDQREFLKGQQVTIDYDYSLKDVPEGDYLATVLYYQDWGDSDKQMWYYRNEFLKEIRIINTPEPVKGDVNGDGFVNGTDLVALTNIILGKSSRTDTADVNGDGQVNGTDYVALANIVLGRSNARTLTRTTDPARLSIEPFNIMPGETKEIIVNLTNPNDEITLVQFDLRLPSGLSLKQTNGEYDIDIAERTTWRKHSLDANDTDGIVRFLLSSNSNVAISGSEGAIIKMTIVADNNFKDGTIMLENILLVSPDEKETKQSTYIYSLSSSQPPSSETCLSIEQPFSIRAGETKEMVINLTNPNDEITLVQFDLRLPAGLTLKQTDGEYDFDIAGRTTWRKHSLDANPINGIIRFLLASNNNIAIGGSEGAIIKMTLVADNNFNGGTILLENILLVSPNENEIKSATIAIGTSESTKDENEPVVPSGWKKVITNGNLANNDVSCFFKTESGSDLMPATISEGTGKNNSRGIVVHSGDNPEENWDTMFFIRTKKKLGDGTKMHIEFDYKASQNAICETQAFGEPQTEFLHYSCIGNVNFTTEWQHFNAEIDITDILVGMQTIAFKLAFNKTATTYYFDNIVVWVQEEDDPAGINNVEMDRNSNSIIYTLSGQRLHKPRKGINISGGKKVVMK